MPSARRSSPELRAPGPRPYPFSLRRFFQFLPGAKGLWPIALLFVVIVGCLLVLANAQMEVLAAVGAYVRGEGLWSKGQKDAVQYLARYAESRDENDFARYLSAIEVPLGDSQARQELEKGRPNPAGVRDGFTRGRNHPDDIDRMAMLFRRFRHFSYMDKAIAIWAAGDRYIAAIHERAQALKSELAAKRQNRARVTAILSEVNALDLQVTPLEDAFSRTLAKGARRAKQVLLETTLVAGGLLLTIGIVFSWMMIRGIQRGELKYRHLLDAASDAIIVSNAESGLILNANRKAEELLGIPISHTVGTSQATLHPLDEQERYRAMRDELLRRGHVTTSDLHVRHLRGHLIPVEISAALTELPGEAVVQSILRDITERKRAESERLDLLEREQAARAEAELASRAKDEFLATLSHELRTPLGAILIWARLLRSGRLDEASRTRALDVIERNTKLQSRLIEDLLDVSRVITGKLRLDTLPVDLASTVEGAIDAVRAAADAKDILLDSVLDHRLGPVLGDRNRLQQVVWNLIANGIKFTPNGGHVQVILERDDGHAIIRVRDNGAGISADFLPHIFERFRQADGARTRSHGGLGLGLAIVRHLVELHGGVVSVESPGEGRGATFSVRLPLLAERTETSRTTALRDSRRSALLELPTLDGVRVLVVDDEADARESIAAVLEQCGARVIAVGAAAAALAALDHSLPDVILCDLAMPGQDGYSFIRELRARGPERGGGLPAAAVTAYARDEDRQRSLAAGFQIHVAKPVEPADLAATVADLVRAGATPSPASSTGT